MIRHDLALDLLGRAVLGLVLVHRLAPQPHRVLAIYALEVVRWAMWIAIILLAIEAIDAT